MYTPEVFLERAAVCEGMARSTRDAENKAVWRRMADRWNRCAELAKSASLAASRHSQPTRHRQPAPSWARPSLEVFKQDRLSWRPRQIGRPSSGVEGRTVQR